MNDALYNYALDTENPETNFALALEYKNIRQTAAAISYFLRAADRTEDLNLAYECLLHMAFCFNLQKNRDYTVRGLYQQSIAILPKDLKHISYMLIRKRENNFKSILFI